MSYDICILFAFIQGEDVQENIYSFSMYLYIFYLEGLLLKALTIDITLIKRCFMYTGIREQKQNLYNNTALYNLIFP